MPSSGVLTELADALGVSVGYMAGDWEMTLETVEFRKEAITSKREEAQVKARVLYMLGCYLVVEELLGLPSMEWDKPRKAPYPVFSHLAEAARRAHALQDHWGLGIDPIPDLVETLEGRGVKALSGEFKHRGGCDPPCTEPFPIPEGEKIRAAMPARPGRGAITEPKAAEWLETPVRELDRRMQEPPGPIRLAPLRNRLGRGHGSFDLASLREQRHDPALRA